MTDYYDNPLNGFTRKELQKLRQRASEAISLSAGSNNDAKWHRAYLELVDAIDRVDAMMSRLMSEQGKPDEEAL